MHRVHGATLAFLLAFLLAFATGASAQQQLTLADSVEVRKVEFTGARAFQDAILATAIHTAPTRCLSVQPLCWLNVGVDRQYLDSFELGWDVVRLGVFYHKAGFREAKISVDTTRTGGRMNVTFRIDEGMPIRVASITFEGSAALPPSVTRDLPLVVDQPLSLIAYEATRDTVKGRLYNLGYARAEVLPSYHIASGAHAAEVRFEVLPGSRARFGTIDVAGADKVSPAVVRRMLTFRQGDVYTREALLRSQRNLFGQELFRHADILAAPDPSSDTIIAVRVQVNEGHLHRVRFGIGLSTAEFLNAESRWISRSFLGGARRLELRGRVSNLFAHQLGETPLFEQSRDIYGRLSGSLATDFTQPWLFGPLNTFGSGLYFERRSLPGVFVRTAGGGYLSMTRTRRPGESFTIGYRPELTKLETAEGDQIFCIGFYACGPREIQALRDPHWLSPIAASYVRDRSNSIFAPTRGYLVRLDAEFAGTPTASDFAYTRLVGEVVDYHALAHRMVFAWRVRSGWSRALGQTDSALGVHPQKRFFAGGPNSVRGFAQYHLGPKLLTIDGANRLARPDSLGGAGCSAQEINAGTCDVAELARSSPDLFRVQAVGGAGLIEGNVELRFPVVGDNVRAAAFIDFGQVFAERSAIDIGELSWTPGLGVRYFSAVGPIRVDIGYNPRGAERVTPVTTDVQFCAPDQGECEDIEPDSTYDYRFLRNTRTLRPLEPVLWNPRDSFFNRLQFHFSIGQAF